jgi:hypothetical protein
MIMEEEVDGPSREKGSMMNYTKKSKAIGSNSLQHSMRSFFKIFQLRRKKESGRGNGRMRDRLLE